MAREEKRNSSWDDVAIKKTPKNKGLVETNDKMLDMVMTMMRVQTAVDIQPIACNFIAQTMG